MPDASLPIPHTSGPARWRLLNESIGPLADQATDRIESPDRVDPQDLLKQGERRLVFRLNGPSKPVVVKAFPLTTFRQSWKHRKYGLAEADNLLLAAERGLPVPRLFGFGWRRRGPWVRWNALLMEWIHGRPLRERLQQADEATRRSLLLRVLPLFQRIYQAGCNHIDLGPHAILIGDDSTPEARDWIIDFQYCRFLAAPSPLTFAGQAGYFGWCLTTHWNLVPRALVEEWFELLVSKLALPDPAALKEVFTRRLTHRLSIAERLGS